MEIFTGLHLENHGKLCFILTHFILFLPSVQGKEKVHSLVVSNLHSETKKCKVQPLAMCRGDALCSNRPANV